MPKVIAIAGLGKGSGKTSTSLNLSASMSLFEKRNLLVDLGGDSGLSKSIIPAFTKDEIIQETLLPYADFMRSGFEESLVFRQIASDPERTGSVFEAFLLKTASHYEYVFLDLSWRMSFLDISALSVCDDLIIVTRNQGFDLDVIHRLILILSQLKRRTGMNMSIFGILTWGHSLQPGGIFQSWPEELKSHVLEHFIPHDIRMENEESDKIPVCLNDLMSPASISYLELCRKIISRKE